MNDMYTKSINDIHEVYNEGIYDNISENREDI
jgi:hypothetical protein